MRGITVRFGKSMFEAIEQEARREGVSMGRFCAEAAYTRMLVSRAQRGELPIEAGAALVEAVRVYMRSQGS